MRKDIGSQLASIAVLALVMVVVLVAQRAHYERRLEEQAYRYSEMCK